MSRLVYACYTVTVLKLTICNCSTVSIFDLSKLDENGKPKWLETIGDPGDFPAEKHRDVLRIMDGIRVSEIRRRNVFEDFINAMFDLLAGFPERKLAKYFKVVHRTLDRLDYTYTKKLAKYFHLVSRMNRDKIKEELLDRQKELRDISRRPQLKIFLEAMNEVYTMEHAIKFRDYVLDVRDYAHSDKREIIDETSNVLKTFMNPIEKLGSRQLTKLERKLRKALKEHDKDPDVERYLLLFNITTKATYTTEEPILL